MGKRRVEDEIVSRNFSRHVCSPVVSRQVTGEGVRGISEWETGGASGSPRIWSLHQVVVLLTGSFYRTCPALSGSWSPAS